MLRGDVPRDAARYFGHVGAMKVAFEIEHESLPIYLDHNATTPLLPEVVDAMVAYLRDHFGNPSSGHVYGRRAHDAIEAARAEVAALLACAPDEIVFTSGGTEANNLAIRGATEASPRRHVVTSVIEHPATSAPCRWLEANGWRVDRIAVDAFGRVLADEARARIDDATALVTIMHSNNETGTLEPIAAIAALARAHGAVVHTDAAQSVGKVAVRVGDLDVDLLSIAGHKLNAPKGVGVLYMRRGTKLRPFVLGAGHERGVRPGTENVASIVGLGVACAAAARRLAMQPNAHRVLRDRLWQGLSALVPGIALHGHPEERLPNTLNVRFPSVVGSAVLAATPEVAASTGSACHDGAESASSVLLAMGIEPALALGAVRLTVGVTTTEADVDAAAAALARGWRAAQAKSSAG
jgi:cysteine desulfurase